MSDGSYILLHISGLGSAHDDRILENTLFNKDVHILDGKYYLADVGYHNIDYLLCPYHRVCYHLKEQAAAGKKPINKEELFNLCHSSLCNVVKRIFGVTKRRFQIFKFTPEYNFTTQIHLVFAITALHHFIYKHQSQEDVYNREELQAEREDRERNNEEDIKIRANLAKEDGEKMNEYRNKMVEEM